MATQAILGVAGGAALWVLIAFVVGLLAGGFCKAGGGAEGEE